MRKPPGSVLAARTVFITGPARGIGEHVARQAAAKGAIVFLAGPEPSTLAAVAGQLGGGWCECDVTDQESLATAVQRAVDMTGGIDYVVAGAGAPTFATVSAGEIEALARTVEVNLTGVMRTVSATLPYVLEARGYYLLVSSPAVLGALPGLSAYGAAHAGVEHFGAALRRELAAAGVAVGMALPGWVDTDLPDPGLAPWPARRSLPVQECASALVRAMERRARRTRVPRSMAIARSLRGVVDTRLGQALLARGARSAATDRPSGAHDGGPGTILSPASTPQPASTVPTAQPAPVRVGKRPTLNVTRLGSGEPLVLLHGIGHRWQAWEPVVDELARHHEVIAVDLPGFGRSPVPAGGMPRTMPELVATVQGELCALGLDRFHVAGNSLGGGLALELATSGVASSATALAPAGFYTPAEAWHAMAVLTGLRVGTFAPAPLLRGALGQAWLRNLAFGALVCDPSHLDRDRMLGDCLSLRAAKGYWRTALGLRRYTFTGKPAPDVPVTVAWGERDRILRPAQARRAREALPDARHVSLPRCGHVPMSDRPAMVARLILETTGAMAHR